MHRYLIIALYIIFFFIFVCLCFFFSSFNSASLIHIHKLRSILFNSFSVTICTTVIVKEKN